MKTLSIMLLLSFLASCAPSQSNTRNIASQQQQIQTIGINHIKKISNGKKIELQVNHLTSQSELDRLFPNADISLPFAGKNKLDASIEVFVKTNKGTFSFRSIDFFNTKSFNLLNSTSLIYKLGSFHEVDVYGFYFKLVDHDYGVGKSTPVISKSAYVSLEDLHSGRNIIIELKSIKNQNQVFAEISPK